MHKPERSASTGASYTFVTPTCVTAAPAPVTIPSEAELLADVTRQICELEDEAARAQLAQHNLPVTDEAVKRLIFARWLFVSLRLREHAIGAAVA